MEDIVEKTTEEAAFNYASLYEGIVVKALKGHKVIFWVLTHSKFMRGFIARKILRLEVETWKSPQTMGTYLRVLMWKREIGKGFIPEL